MSYSVWPHRRQPTRLPHPWDSPGKNTGVGWHFLLQCMKVKSESEVAQSCPTLRDPMDCSLPGSSVHGIFQAKSTGVGCHCLFWIYVTTLIYFWKCNIALWSREGAVWVTKSGNFLHHGSSGRVWRQNQGLKNQGQQEMRKQYLQVSLVVLHRVLKELFCKYSHWPTQDKINHWKVLNCETFSFPLIFLCSHLCSIVSSNLFIKYKFKERALQLLRICVWVAQLCLTLCDPMDCSLPGYSDNEILQGRILEWVVISFSGATKNKSIKPCEGSFWMWDPFRLRIKPFIGSKNI